MKALVGTLEIIEDEATDVAKVTVGDIAGALNHRGFGPLLMAPAFLTILPTGAIPGVPAISAAFILLVAGQIIAGRDFPWLPKRLKAIRLSRRRLVSAVNRAKPYARKVDRYVRPRLRPVSDKTLQPLVAPLCCLLAVLMAAIGFVPFMPALLSIPILFFALGITARDGIMTLCGFGFTLAAALLVLWLSGFMGGEDQLHIAEPVYIEHFFSDVILQ